MKVRSVTCFVPMTYPFAEGSIVAVGRFLKSARQMLEDAGLEIQTLRLATPPFTEVLGDPTATQVADMAQSLEAACANQGSYVAAASSSARASSTRPSARCDAPFSKRDSNR